MLIMLQLVILTEFNFKSSAVVGYFFNYTYRSTYRVHTAQCTSQISLSDRP